MNKQELENRLVEFSVSIIELTKELERVFEAQHLSRQIIRSGTASALIYGEAQGAPTKKDFIHKISLVLRELRETHINLRIISKSKLIVDNSRLNRVMEENNELIAIFHRTLQTALKNENKP